MCKIKTSLFILLILTLLHNNSFSYTIQVQIQNSNHQKVFFGIHQGPEYRIIDSVLVNNNIALFKGKAKLATGVYFIVIPPQSRFDFIIENEQNIIIKTDTRNILDSLSSTGEKQYNYFLQMQKEVADINKERAQLNMELDFYKRIKKDSIIKTLNIKIDSLNTKQSEVYQKYREINSSNNNFFGKILRILEPYNLSQDIEKLKYVDPEKYYQYYVEHFLDRVDFNDVNLLNTPEFVLHKLIKDYCYYFVDIQISNKEMSFKNLDNLILKMQYKNEYKQYILNYLISRYDNPQDLRLEHLFVYLYRNYFMIKKPAWVSEYAYAILKFKVESVQDNLIGNIAKNLYLPDINDKYYSLYDMQSKYKIVLFWEVDCDICNETALILQSQYPKFKEKDIDIYAVYVKNEELQEWLQFVNEHDISWINVYDKNRDSKMSIYYGAYKTPRLYILDKDNVIIAKDVQALKVFQAIESYEKNIDFLKKPKEIIFGN